MSDAELFLAVVIGLVAIRMFWTIGRCDGSCGGECDGGERDW